MMETASTIFSLDEIKAINDVINELHDDSLSLEDYMSHFMNRLREQVYFDKSDFMFYTYDAQENHYVMQDFSPIKWSESEIDNYIRTYMHLDDVLPILSQTNPIAFRNNDFFSPKKRKETKYYKEFVEYAQLEISIDANIPLSHDSNTRAIIGIFRNSDRKEFTQKDLEIVKLYQTHLSQTLDKQLSKNDLQGESLFSSFDRFESFGICILDETLNILSYNPTFRKYALESGDTIQESMLSQKLMVVSGEMREEHQSAGPLSFEASEKRYLIEVSRCSGKKKYLGMIHSLSDYFLQRLSSLKDTYDISNREFEILFLMLKRGMTIDNISERLYISPATVKRHISSAYQKIGISHQKQLLSILELL